MLDRTKRSEHLKFLAESSKFRTKCALCGRVGQSVSESIEGRGFSYCDDIVACKGALADKSD
jgi:hypothetical protein